MKYLTVNRLSDTELDAVNSLISYCSAAEQLKYSFFTGESGCEEDYYILCCEEQLVGFMSCFAGDTIELSGIVHPDYRRQHIFTNMYRKASEHFSDSKIVFSGHDNYPGLRQCANALGYANSNHEYLMEYTGADIQCHSQLEMEADNDSTFYYYLGDEYIGQCSLFEDGQTVNIYNVEVDKDYRGRGYGRQILCDILNNVVNRDKRIILQVSESNKPACRLYAGCGFEIIDSVVFYSRLV